MRLVALTALFGASISMFAAASNEAELQRRLSAARATIDRVMREKTELERTVEDLQDQAKQTAEMEAQRKAEAHESLREQDAEKSHRMSELSDTAKAQNTELYRLSDRSNETIWAALLTSLFGFLALLVQGVLKIYQDSQTHKWQVEQAEATDAHRKLELQRLSETKDAAEVAANESVTTNHKLDSMTTN